MTDDPKNPVVAKYSAQDVMTWLKQPLGITAPRWAFVAAGLAALVLLGVALD